MTPAFIRAVQAGQNKTNQGNANQGKAIQGTTGESHLMEVVNPEATGERDRSGKSAARRPQWDQALDSRRWFPGLPLALYALALLAVTWRHEMFRDEMQAWIIARDSHSLPDLFHNLRYEGHPALWHTLLYFVSRFSWNPAWMQAVNYVISVLTAYAILSFDRIPRLTRVLWIFSFLLFFGYAVLARNYMLAVLMLVLEVRCLIARRLLWAAVCGALAINSHFFAIPIALALFAIMVFRKGHEDLRRPARLLLAGSILGAGLLTAYLEVRPPADQAVGQYGHYSSPIEGFLVAEGRSWQAFLPIPEQMIPARYSEMLTPRSHSSWVAATFSLLLILAAVYTLRTFRGRAWFLGLVLVECLLFTVTVHIPSPRHYGFLLIALLLAFFVESSENRDANEQGWGARGLLIAMLAVQVVAALGISAMDLALPYAAGKQVSTFLEERGLSNNPLVLEPPAHGTVELGYLERPTAYYPACHCMGSFMIYKNTWDQGREVTRPELDALYAGAHEPVVVVTSTPFKADEVQTLGLSPLQFFERVIFTQERAYVYLFNGR